MSWTRGDSTGNGLADTTTRRDEAEDLEPSLSPAPPRPSAPMPPGGAPLPPGGAPLPPGGAPLPPGGARMPPRGRGGARGGGGRSFAGRRLGRTLSSRSSGSATPGTAPPGPPPSGVRSARPPAPPVQQQLRGCTSPPAQQQQQQQLTLQEEEGEEGEEQTTDSSASEEEDDPGVAIEQSCADLGAASSPTNARYTTDSSDEGSRYGDETGDAGGAGYMRRGDAYHDDDFGGIEALRAELQRVQRRSNAEQSQWEERLRSRDAQVRELEDEIQRARSEIDRLRNRLFEAEPDLMPASRAEELSATLAGTVERLQQENLDLKAQVRAQNSPKSLEDEAEQLIHFSDRVEQGQAELQVVQQELRRVREDNARLRSMVQRGSGPAPVSVDAVVAVSAQVVQRVHSPEPLAPEVTNTIPTSQLQAELEDLRKRNNRMRFQNDQLMQKVRKLEKQCDERSSGWQGDDFPGISGGGGETAWSAFGVAASSRKGCINDDSYGGGADDDDDDDNDSDVEAESAPLRNESDWRGDRSDGGTLSPFQRGNTLSISGLFEPLTELGVYMIKRQNFKCTKSSQASTLRDLTVIHCVDADVAVVAVYYGTAAASALHCWATFFCSSQKVSPQHPLCAARPGVSRIIS
jgi:predicted nuclease with TOPRIM domain